MDHRAHALQIDLVHDPVARRNHFHILEGQFAPLDEMEAVFIAPVFDGAVFLKGLRIVATALHGQRVVHDQLHGHHGIDGGRIATLPGDRIAQAGQIDKSRLAQDVMTDHAGREPGKVALALAVNDLREVLGQVGRIAAPYQVLGMDAAGIGQCGPAAGA